MTYHNTLKKPSQYTIKRGDTKQNTENSVALGLINSTRYRDPKQKGVIKLHLTDPKGKGRKNMNQSESQVPKLAYSVKEFGQAVGIGRSLAYQLVRSGKIKVRQVGDRLIIPASAVMEFLEGSK